MNDFSINKKEYKYIFLLLLIAIPALFLGLGEHELLSPDEPREGEIAWEMWVSKNFAVPTLNGEAFLEKPPLFYWSVVAAFDIAGKANAFLARIPSAFFGLGILIFTYACAAKMFGRMIGFSSALITCSTNEFMHRTHMCMIDTSLAFFVIGAIYFFVSGYMYEKKKILNFSLMYVMMSLAFLSKGFIGAVIPFSAVFVFLILEKKLSGIKELRIWLGVVIFMVITAPWFILLWREGGTKYFHVFFIDNHYDRFLYASLGHKHSLFYYVPKIFEVLFPWAIIFPLVVYDIIKNIKVSQLEKGREILFTRLFAFVPFAVLSLPSTKRSLYLFPIVPAFSILTALWLDKEFLKNAPSKLARALGVILAVVVPITMFVFIGIQVWYQNINLWLIGCFAAALILAIFTLKSYSKNEFQRLFVSIALCTVFMFTPYFYVVREVKSYNQIADVLKKEVADLSELRTFDLSEKEKSLSFYLNRLIPDDETWNVVEKNLLAEKKVVYLVSEKQFKRISEKVPKGIKVKQIGVVSSHKLFLLSN